MLGFVGVNLFSCGELDSLREGDANDGHYGVRECRFAIQRHQVIKGPLKRHKILVIILQCRVIYPSTAASTSSSSIVVAPDGRQGLLSLVMTGGKAMTGSMVQLMVGEGFEKINAKDVRAVFMSATGHVWAPAQDSNDEKSVVTVPKGVMGRAMLP